MDISQPVIAPGMAVGQLQVIEAEKVQNRRLEVVYRDDVLGDFIAHLVAFSVGRTAVDASAGQPRAVGLGVVAASFGGRVGDEGRAPEFRRPDDQGIVEHPARFQIVDQSRDRLIDVLRQPVIALHVGVGVPVVVNGGAAVDQLDKADAAFGHSPRRQALPAETFGAAALNPVELQGGIGFLREIEGLGCLHLHPKGRLERLDPSVQ